MPDVNKTPSYEQTLTDAVRTLGDVEASEVKHFLGQAESAFEASLLQRVPPLNDVELEAEREGFKAAKRLVLQDFLDNGSVGSSITDTVRTGSEPLTPENSNEAAQTFRGEAEADASEDEKQEKKIDPLEKRGAFVFCAIFMGYCVGDTLFDLMVGTAQADSWVVTIAVWLASVFVAASLSIFLAMRPIPKSDSDVGAYILICTLIVGVGGFNLLTYLLKGELPQDRVVHAALFGTCSVVFSGLLALRRYRAYQSEKLHTDSDLLASVQDKGADEAFGAFGASLVGLVVLCGVVYFVASLFDVSGTVVIPAALLIFGAFMMLLQDDQRHFLVCLLAGLPLAVLAVLQPAVDLGVAFLMGASVLFALLVAGFSKASEPNRFGVWKTMGKTMVVWSVAVLCMFFPTDRSAARHILDLAPDVAEDGRRQFAQLYDAVYQTPPGRAVINTFEGKLKGTVLFRYNDGRWNTEAQEFNMTLTFENRMSQGVGGFRLTIFATEETWFDRVMRTCGAMSWAHDFKDTLWPGDKRQFTLTWRPDEGCTIPLEDMVNIQTIMNKRYIGKIIVEPSAQITGLVPHDPKALFQTEAEAWLGLQ